MEVITGEIKKWTIYKITNPIGQVYIGCSSNYKRRVQRYKHKETKSQPLIHASMLRYGFENHSFDILNEFESDKGYAHGREMFWIRSYMSNACKFPEIKGLNLCDGGQGTIGRPKSEAEKIQSSIRNKGRKHIDYIKSVISMHSKGNTHNKGRKPVKDIIKKRRDAMVDKKGKPIAQYEIDGQFVRNFDCIKDASIELGIPYHRISMYCRGKYVSSELLTYTFKYI